MKIVLSNDEKAILNRINFKMDYEKDYREDDEIDELFHRIAFKESAIADVSDEEYDRNRDQIIRIANIFDKILKQLDEPEDEQSL